MMGLIYWHANRVIVWLGRDDDCRIPASEVFELIRDTSKLATVLMQDHDNDINSVPEVSLTDLAGYDVKKWTILANFFELTPWFGRGWVVQEIGLAQEALFICGRAEIKLGDYLPFVRWICRKGQLLCNKFDIDLRAQNLATEYWLSTRTPDEIVHLSFIQVLEQARGVTCTNARDYVYAFLGHPSAFEAYPGDPRPYVNYRWNYFTGDRQPIVEVDYGKSVADVYTDLAKAMILYFGNLTVLSCVHRLPKTLQDDSSENASQDENVAFAESPKDSDFPSWVPRWDITSSAAPLSLGYYYAATRSSGLNFSFLGTDLLLQGHEIDTIVWMHSIWADFSEAFYHPASTSTEVVENRLEALWNTYRFRLWQLKLDVKADRAAFLFTLTAGTIDSQPAEDEENRVQFMKNVAAYELQTCEALGTALNDERKRKLEVESVGGDSSRFLSDVQQISEGRALFFTKTGRLGLSHKAIEVGDSVFLLKGAVIPFILRTVGEREGRYQLIGEAYTHGVMRGEAFVEAKLREVVLC